MPLYLDEGERVTIPPTGKRLYFIDTDGILKELRAGGATSPVISAGTAPLDRAKARAIQLCGSTVNRPLWIDFKDDLEWRTAIAGAGTASQSVTERGGVITISTGGNGITGLLPHGTTTVWIDNPQTALWYNRYRVKWTSAVSANTEAWCGFQTAGGSGPFARFGIRGSQSATNLAWSTTNNAGTDQGSGVTGIVLDTTTYHTVEIWNDGTNVNFAYDEVLQASTAKANVGTSPVTPMVFVSDTAVIRTMNVDSWYVITPEN